MLGASALAAPLQEQPLSGPGQSSETLGALKSIERFDGRTGLRTRRGKLEELHVVIRNWQLHGRLRVEKFPEPGFAIVHLHSGKVVTVINGKEQQRNGGDFWIVPAGSSMAVQVVSESALLETTAVRAR